METGTTTIELSPEEKEALRSELNKMNIDQVIACARSNGVTDMDLKEIKNNKQEIIKKMFIILGHDKGRFAQGVLRLPPLPGARKTKIEDIFVDICKLPRSRPSSRPRSRSRSRPRGWAGGSRSGRGLKARGSYSKSRTRFKKKLNKSRTQFKKKLNKSRTRFKKKLNKSK